MGKKKTIQPASKFKIEKVERKIATIMFRLPDDLVGPFNEVMKESNQTAQKVCEEMIRHCLK